MSARPQAKQSTRQRRRARSRRAGKSRVGLWTLAAMLVLVAVYLGALEISRPHVAGDRLRLDTYFTLVDDNRVRTAQILDEDAYVVGTYERRDGSVVEYNTPIIELVKDDLILDSLIPAGIPTTVDQQVKKRIASLALVGLPGLMLVVLFGYLVLSYRRGTGLFAVRSGALRVESAEGGVTFADIAGHDDAIVELRELRGYLADPERYTALGAEAPKGVLLYGPPGCGKTMLARALANEAEASFYSISGSDFVEMYVGVGAARVRDLFKEARENAPALIFVDELDAVGRARGGGGAGGAVPSTEQEQALNQLLAEMDGFSTSAGIVVIGATNRPDVLDKALLRPGRFDRSIGLALPDEDARLAILRVHARRKSMAPGVDLAPIAHGAVGLSGADLASVLNEAALLAVRDGKGSISGDQLATALQRILEAPERQRRLSARPKSVGRRYTDKDRVTFADVGGQREAVADLAEVKDFLAHPEPYTAMGSQIPRGVLLYGPPGCGKTLMARALAGETNAAFFTVAGSEFVELYVGTGAARIRDLFAEARSMAPAIVFIDEIDAIGRARTGAGPVTQASHPDAEQALNQLLAEMDGVVVGQGLLVLGATNRPDTLDPALLRPGRFDRTVGLALPDEAGRLDILAMHGAGKQLDAEADLADLARRSIGLSGADLASIMNEAGILAVRAGRTTISQAELNQALTRVLRAPAEQRRLAMRARSVGQRYSAGERITFADVAGVDDAVTELEEVRLFLSDPERFTAAGARVPRGILLSGPPGCGKTLLARAVAGEANAAFFSVAGSEFVELFVGQGASRVRDIFGEAKSMAPAILFIDEVDAVGGHRTVATSPSDSERDQTLNQILVEMDGFEANSGLIVMAATNRPDLLDAALVRPGRFDRHVAITYPDRRGRLAILELHARGKTLAPGVDLGVVAGLTQGFTGADLANVLNEAALLTGRGGRIEITPPLLDEGIDRVRLGVASRGTLMTDEERRMVAYHESGHGLVALAVTGATPPHKLTIVPRGATLGRCMMADEHDRVVHTRSMLLARLAVSLGGIVAEDLVFGDTGSGAASDLAYVGSLARRMVREWGMSEALGLVAYPDESTPSWPPKSPVYSEESARLIDAEVRRLIDEATALARAALSREALDRVAKVLLEHETIDAAQLEEAAGPTSPVVPEPGAGRALGANR